MDRERFQRAIDAFDRANGEDPKLQTDETGQQQPAQLLHARRLSAWVQRLDPAASEALQLAARCQHIRRWTMPRETFPPGRLGYKKWRSQLARLHADTAAEILQQVGYSQALIDDVRAINLKQDIKGNPDTQTIEDALCLAFLQHQLAELVDKTEPQKMVTILQKTWDKMSERGRQVALQLDYTAEQLALLERALST